MECVSGGWKTTSGSWFSSAMYPVDQTQVVRLFGDKHPNLLNHPASPAMALILFSLMIFMRVYLHVCKYVCTYVHVEATGGQRWVSFLALAP